MVNLLETESFGKYLRYAFYVVKYYECLIIRLRGSLIRLGKGLVRRGETTRGTALGQRVTTGTTHESGGLLWARRQRSLCRLRL